LKYHTLSIYIISSYPIKKISKSISKTIQDIKTSYQI